MAKIVSLPARHAPHKTHHAYSSRLFHSRREQGGLQGVHPCHTVCHGTHIHISQCQVKLCRNHSKPQSHQSTWTAGLIEEPYEVLDIDPRVYEGHWPSPPTSEVGLLIPVEAASPAPSSGVSSEGTRPLTNCPNITCKCGIPSRAQDRPQRPRNGSPDSKETGVTCGQHDFHKRSSTFSPSPPSPCGPHTLSLALQTSIRQSIRIRVSHVAPHLAHVPLHGGSQLVKCAHGGWRGPLVHSHAHRQLPSCLKQLGSDPSLLQRAPLRQRQSPCKRR